MFFNNLKKNQPAANVDQQSTVKSTPESTLCVELSDEELCAVNGGSLSGFLSGVIVACRECFLRVRQELTLVINVDRSLDWNSIVMVPI
jgi:hypothetical protein